MGIRACSWLGSLSSWTAPAPGIRVSGPLYNNCTWANFAKGNQNTTKPKAVSIYFPGPHRHIGRILVGLRNRAGSPSLLWNNRTDIICTSNVQTVSIVAQNSPNMLNVAQCTKYVATKALCLLKKTNGPSFDSLLKWILRVTCLSGPIWSTGTCRCFICAEEIFVYHTSQHTISQFVCLVCQFLPLHRADISHNRQNRRWCTFFTPVYFLA